MTDTSCKQITDLVFDFLTGNLSRGVERKFREHLRICPDCVNFLSTYKKTVALTGRVRAEDIPAQVRTNVMAFLRKRMRRSSRS